MGEFDDFAHLHALRAKDLARQLISEHNGTNGAAQFIISELAKSDEPHHTKAALIEASQEFVPSSVALQFQMREAVRKAQASALDPT